MIVKRGRVGTIVPIGEVIERVARGVDEDDRREAAKVLREIDDEEDFQDVDGLDVVTY